MVYIVTDSQSDGRTMLVKADSEEDLNSRIRLSETQSISGHLTTAEITALNSGSFCVITA